MQGRISPNPIRTWTFMSSLLAITAMKLLNLVFWTTTCAHAILISIIVQLILWILSSMQCQSLNVGRFLIRLYGFQFLHQGEIYLWQETVLNGHIANCNFPCHMPTFLTFTMWWSYVSKDTPRINYIAVLCIIHLSSIMMVFSHTKTALATTTVYTEWNQTTGITDWILHVFSYIATLYLGPCMWLILQPY